MDSIPPAWLKSRGAGVLAHVSSLPGEFGIGNLGRGAREFVDFLREAGMTYWQMCPLGPTGYGDSPYQTFSSDAGNPYFIDLNELESAGLLNSAELVPLRQGTGRRVDYGELGRNLCPLLTKAADRFLAAGMRGLPGCVSYAEFCEVNANWLGSFADFMSLKAHFGGEPWTVWPEEFRDWAPDLRPRLPLGVQREAERQRFYQYVFFEQWSRLRRYAAEQGVRLIGDLPMLVSFDSVDPWRHRAVFRLSPSGQPLACAGAAPDAHSTHGEIWGNPLYDWSYLSRTNYTWWIDRLRAALNRFDVLHLDHFRGFEQTWAIAPGEADARHGRWMKGPGLSFFDKLRKAVPGASLIANDSGTPAFEVGLLRRAAELPGIKIVQRVAGADRDPAQRPHHYPFNSVAYTGTHEGNTLRGWLETLEDGDRDYVDDYFQLNGATSSWPMIRATLATASRLVVIPIQDLLDLSGDAVLSRSGATVGNWQWRFTRDQLAYLSRTRSATLRRWLELFERDGTSSDSSYSDSTLAQASLRP